METVYRMSPYPKVHKLRDLEVTEISGVTQAANPYAHVKIAKSQEVLPMVEVAKRASAMWGVYVDLIAKRDGITKSAAVDRALRDDTGRSLYETARDAHLQDQMQKMGAAGGISSWDGGNSAGQDSLGGHGPGEAVDGAANLQRLRAGHAEKSLVAFNGLIDAHVASGMTRSQAQMKAMREHPSLWSQAKDATGLAPHDGYGPGMSGRTADSGGRVVSDTKNRPHSAIAPLPPSSDAGVRRPSRFM